MRKYVFFTIILLILLSIGAYLYQKLTYTYVTVQFKELRPIQERIPVYYKGIVIGKAVDKKHSQDYNHTLLKVVLYPRHLQLPSNSEFYLKQIVQDKKTQDFLEIVYPDVPSDKLIANGIYLKGHTTTDMESYMKSLNPEDLDSIKANLAGAAENLNIALGGLSELFILLQEMVNDNRPNLKGATANINNATKNIDTTTLKINNAIKEQQIINSLSNIEASINNFKQISTDIGNTSIPSINKSLDSTQEILENVNSISCGVRQTLRKRFGGLRLFFGKTIDEPACCTCGR